MFIARRHQPFEWDVFALSHFDVLNGLEEQRVRRFANSLKRNFENLQCLHPLLIALEQPHQDVEEEINEEDEEEANEEEEQNHDHDDHDMEVDEVEDNDHHDHHSQEGYNASQSSIGNSMDIMSLPSPNSVQTPSKLCPPSQCTSSSSASAISFLIVIFELFCNF